MIRRLLPEELGGLLETINREQHFLYYSYLAFRKKHTVHYGQFSECGELSTPSRSDDYVELGNIGTDAAWRRQGYGKKVCAELTRKGRAITPDVYLNVLEENLSAVRLYQSLGYVTVCKQYIVEFAL
ncbi:hypothetical protein PAEVO_11760 [Paenibacillus sp. GM2FR]|uniref:GNAT family N-acetyltransferase n=1 Tax=Paenibacillus sp. GM2FR TaxID=2059268 RepID=UPI000C27929C|nr:GNAT family N-acetyltransferase [Paenibacillus sp. GM2FR]PJN54455.1 hypothetical protein PAEVO_11760 [Paenibacillus sp. GM2FR]